MADPLRPGEQRIGELPRLEFEIAIDRLEPFGRVACAVLQLEHFQAALGLIFGQRRRAVEAGTTQHFSQLDRVLQGQLGARSDREMGGVGGITDQDDLVVMPCVADDPAELEPRRRAAEVGSIAQQRVAAELGREHLLAGSDGFGLIHCIEAEPVPGRLRAFDDERRTIVVKAIGVCPDPACVSRNEREGERVEAFGRAEPDKAIGALLYVDGELVGMRLAKAAVDAIGGDHQVELAPRVEAGVAFMSVVQLDAESARARGQNVEQALAADADEAMSRRSDAHVLEMDFDVIPVREFLGNHPAGHRIVGHQIFDRLIGKDDAPAEGHAFGVALEQVNLVRRIAKFHRYGEVEASRTPTDACNFHVARSP